MAISRRQLLTWAGAGAGLVLLSPLAGCSAGAVVTRTVGQYLAEFALAVGAEVAANNFSDWLDQQNNADHTQIMEINDMMMQNGFSDFSDTKVHHQPQAAVVFYGVDNIDGFNNCAAFFGNSRGVTLVEGPIIVGLSKAATDWKKQAHDNSNVPAAGLLPKRALGPVSGRFQQSTEVSYETRSGYVNIRYFANAEQKQGRVIVDARLAPDHTLIHHTDYRFSWR